MNNIQKLEREILYWKAIALNARYLLLQSGVEYDWDEEDDSTGFAEANEDCSPV
jgi:hypothetical protein